METCERCGASLPVGVRFCPSCGAPAPGSDPPSERKLVTVLFADLTSSTSLAEGMDPEAFKELMDEYFRVLRRELEAEGGTVEKFIGDAVMAVFGVPTAHEDDPARALRAALRMRVALGGLNERLASTHGIELSVRTGVNTGEVIAVTEPRPGEAMVAGDAVNVAKRLEEAAAPGQVLVSERTAHASAGANVRDVGPLELKGKSRTVRAYEVMDVEAWGSRTLDRRAPMVGREAELTLLRSLYQRVTTDRRPHLVTIYGDPGVGKSRLVEEFQSWAAGLDAAPAAVAGRCLPYGEGVTYWPLAEILKGGAGVVDSDPSDVALSKIAASAAALLSTGLSANPERAVWALCVTVGLDPPGSPFAGMEPRQLHREIVEAWRSYFSALAESGPTTVVIEDLHWADPAMLQLLGDLVDTAQGALLFLCPSRPDLATRRREWGGGRHNGSSILLQPLPVPDAARLLDLLAADALSPEQRGLVLERAGGNPLFLEELIRYFVLDRPPARTSRHVAEAAEIPDTVQGLLAARMDLLDPADKRVLQSAAVVGRVFWNGPVLRLLNGEGERLDESLRRLQERGLVEVRLASSVRDEDEYVFNHVLTRDVAYESLPRRERGPAHARVAAWLEERVSERASEFSELLAHHYGEAHRMISRSDHVDPEAAEELRRNAFRFSLLAAEQARAKLVLDVAARFAESALSMASGPLELSVALEELGAIRYLNSQGDEGWENLTQALDLRLSVEPDDHRDIARLAGRALEIPARAPGTMRTRPPRAAIEPYLEIGLEHAGENDSEELARLLIAHSFLPVTAKETYIPEHEWRQARQAGERAAEMALRLHRPDLASAALDGLAMPFMERDQWGQADRIVRRRLALTESLSDAWELADIFASASQAALFIGRFREAEGFADQGILAAGSAAPPLALYCLNWRAWARQCRGAWDEAMQDVEAVRARLGDLRERPPALAADTFAVAAFISEARGDPTGADEALRTLSWLEEVEDRPGPGWASFRAQVLARRGEFAEAHAALDAAHGDEGHDYGRGVLLQARCAVVELEGNWDRAPALAVTALAHATEAGLLALPLFSGRLNAIVALANGDDAAGIEALGAAARGLHDLGAEWEAARADLALAEALRARSEASAVRALLDRSIRTFQRLGSVAELQRAQELVDAI